MPENCFHLPVRVYYEDTDAAGVVYYAGYLRYMERARTEWLRHHGFDVEHLSRELGTVFVVRSITVQYLNPARLSDLLDVTVHPRRVGRASIVLEQEVRRDGATLCDGVVRVACLEASGFKPIRMPEALLSELNAWKTS